MTEPSNRFAVLGVLLATFIATPAGADDPKPATKPAENAAEATAKGTTVEPTGKAAGAPGELRTALQDLRAELRAGKIKPAELKDRLAKLRDDAKDRRRAYRDALKERWGDTLAKPGAREELRLHARRTALLNQALILVEAERKGADKTKLVERIEKLLQKENDRHAKVMERIKSGQPGAAPVAAGTGTTGATAPAAAPAAAEPVKAGEK